MPSDMSRNTGIRNLLAERYSSEIKDTRSQLQTAIEQRNEARNEVETLRYEILQLKIAIKEFKKEIKSNLSTS